MVSSSARCAFAIWGVPQALRLVRQAGGLSKASKQGYLELVEKGTKETPLHWAAQSGRADAARYLLESGARKADKDAAGKTAQDHALENGHASVAKLLAQDPD